jgi:glutamate dehydrogenase (NAD(P)+)
VGSITAKYLHQNGFKVVAVTDVQGGLYNPAGLDIQAISSFVKAGNSLTRFEDPSAERIDNQSILTLPVDVLVPAAVAHVITEKNVDKVQCKILAEGANGPVTPEADKILAEKGIFVIPDILANSGGVVVSYFEWVQDIQHLFWSEADVVKKLYELMDRSFNDVYMLSLEKKVTPRVAAMMLGVGRVAEAKRLRGLYP